MSNGLLMSAVVMLHALSTRDAGRGNQDPSGGERSLQEEQSRDGARLEGRSHRTQGAQGGDLNKNWVGHYDSGFSKAQIAY